jgi:signal transduction histidine kinase
MKPGNRHEIQTRFSKYRYWIPTWILLVGVGSFALLFWAYQINARQGLNWHQADTIMDLQVKTAVFHLWFEEAISEHDYDQMQSLLSDLEDALKLSGAILHGGMSEHGLPLVPIEEPRYREYTTFLEPQLVKLKQIALERYEDATAGAIGSALDDEFDQVFSKFMERARTLELLTEQASIRDNVRTRRLLFAVIVLWAAIVAVSTIWLFRWQDKRLQAETALERAHGELEHRVLERTGELERSNDRLQNQIVERWRAEEALRKSEEGYRKLSIQFKTLLDTIPDRITLIARDMNVLWANKSAGILPDSGAGRSATQYCYTFWHGRAEPCRECPAIKSFQSGQPANAHIIGTDGRHWEIRSVPIINEEGDLENVLEVAADITEKLNLQAEAMRAAHLASLGELSAGVAHEINNPINGIINCAQILCDKSPAGGLGGDLAARILKEGDRIGTIVRGLLAFARDTQEEKQPAAVAQILSDALALTRSQMHKEGIALSTDLPPDLPDIVANPQQIQQVFMNVISNARYALNQKYTTPDADKALEIRAERLSAGGRRKVRIVFIDRGAGIAPDLMNKILEPFFTTKPDSKGTGLGLSISHGIVSDHGGRFVIESQEGEFTKVIIDLPAKEGSNGTDSDHR